MFGHALRLPRETPAQQSMDLYFSGGKRKRGRPPINLATKLKEDLERAGTDFKTANDLDTVRELASDREGWQTVIRMCDA